MTPYDLMHDYISCAHAGDWERGFGYFAEDIRIRIPGTSSMAGEHRGRDVAVRYVESARALSAEHDVEVQVDDMLVSEERVALLVTERFHTADGTVEIRRCNVYKWEAGQIVEIWIFEADQHAVDALFAVA